jgi:hypothetical protein
MEAWDEKEHRGTHGKHKTPLQERGRQRRGGHVMYNSGAANSNYAVSIGGKKLQFAMPASGWATVKDKP